MEMVDIAVTCDLDRDDYYLRIGSEGTGATSKRQRDQTIGKLHLILRFNERLLSERSCAVLHDAISERFPRELAIGIPTTVLIRYESKGIFLVKDRYVEMRGFEDTKEYSCQVDTWCRGYEGIFMLSGYVEMEMSRIRRNIHVERQDRIARQASNCPTFRNQSSQYHVSLF